MDFPIIGVAHMLRRALNTLDYRLMDHGERVSYIVLCMLREDKSFTDIQLKEIYYISMFHDIGAYKTEVIDSLANIDSLFSFEISSTLNHSIYGYLFMKNFNVFDEFVDAVLFHHFTYPKLLESDCINKSLASTIFIADRIDVLITKGIAKNTEDIIKFTKNPVFNPDDIKLLISLEERSSVLTNLFNGKYIEESLEFLNTKYLQPTQMESLVRMLPYAIDFRSEYTVTHTIATVKITMVIADLLGLDKTTKQNLYYGSLLHDIGKISTSLMILEKDTTLSEYEFDIMRDHVLLTEYILKGRVSDEILNIAIRHHEKLDGSGYPYHVTEENLTTNERIVGIADIMSALLGKRSYKEPFNKTRSQSILQNMVNSHKICGELVDLVFENYDLIANIVEECNAKAIKDYNDMNNEFNILLKKYTN